MMATRRRIISPWLIYGLFLALILFLSTDFYLGKLLHPTGWGEDSFWINLVWNFNRWFPWALLTPAILWTGRRYPLDRRDWARNLPVHAVAAVLSSGIHSVLVFVFHHLTALLGLTTVISLRMVAVRHLHYDILTYGVILGVGYILDYYRKYRERELAASQMEARLARANLQVLKAQIHPHFLFNTLNAISAFVHEDPETADRMISQLSEFLRLTLDQSAVPEITLREEVASLDLYLDIMKTRLGERLRTELDLDPSVSEARVPSFLLQPLVENAIRHGIATRREGGSVIISAAREADRLVIRVSDDGSGFPVEPEGLFDRGIGLSTTRDRLDRLYGHEGTVTLTNRPAGGAEVVIALPLRWADPGPHPPVED